MLSARTLTRLSSVASFLNTAPGPRGGQDQPERLTAGTQLTTLVPALQEDEVRLRVAAAAVARAHELRSALTRAWALAAEDEAAAIEAVNALLAAVGPLRLVAADDAVDFGPAQTPPDAVERLTALAALALAEAAVDGELSRLRVCAGEDCENALVDGSRNRSKRFCDEANCANRTHVRTYRARLAEAEPETTTAAGTPETERAEDTGKAASKKKKAKKKDSTESADEAAPRKDKKAKKAEKKKAKKKRKKAESSAD